MLNIIYDPQLQTCLSGRQAQPPHFRPASVGCRDFYPACLSVDRLQKDYLFLTLPR